MAYTGKRKQRCCIHNTDVCHKREKTAVSTIGAAKGINKEHLEQVITKYPLIGQLYDIRNTFQETIFSRDANRLENWIKEAQDIESEEIAGFVNGITHDKEPKKCWSSNFILFCL